MRAAGLGCALLATIGSARAQRLIVPGTPVTPGVPFNVQFVIGPEGGTLARDPLVLLQPDSGERIAPVLVARPRRSSAPTCLPPPPASRSTTSAWVTTA